MKRQDAHPTFRAARLEKQIRDGLPRAPISARASLDELKGLFAQAAIPAALKE